MNMNEKVSKRETNKSQKKTAMVDAAGKLFLKKGFDNTSIDDVAKEAGLTKRTLYQYFNSKEDLYYAVIVEGAKQLTASYEEALSQGKNAIDRVRLANQVYLQFYREFSGMFRLMNYTPSNLQNSEASPHCQELKKYDGIRMMHYFNIINEAKTDGSINNNLDLNKAVFFEFFTAFSLLSAISNSDSSMWDKMNMSEKDFLDFSFDLLVNAIKQ